MKWRVNSLRSQVVVVNTALKDDWTVRVTRGAERFVVVTVKPAKCRTMYKLVCRSIVC